MYADGHVTILFARKWRVLTVMPTLGHCSWWRHCKRVSFPCAHMTVTWLSAYIVFALSICLEAFIVGNGTRQKKPTCGLLRLGTFNTYRHMHCWQIPTLCWKFADFRAFCPCGGHNTCTCSVPPGTAEEGQCIKEIVTATEGAAAGAGIRGKTTARRGENQSKKPIL